MNAIAIGIWVLGSIGSAPRDMGPEPNDSSLPDAISVSTSNRPVSLDPEAATDEPDGAFMAPSPNTLAPTSNPLKSPGEPIAPPSSRRTLRPSRGVVEPGAQPLDRLWGGGGTTALVVVSAAIVVLYMVLRRWSPSVRAADGGVLRVAARVGLTSKHQAVLLQLGRRMILIGVSPDRVETLCDVRDAVEASELAARAGLTVEPGGTAFAGMVARELNEYADSAEWDGEKPKSATRGDRRDGSLRSLHELFDRLRKLKVG
jgi:flagellar biogenesis protein FliO